MKNAFNPDLDIDLLRIPLEMFNRQFAYSAVDEAANVMQCHVPDVRKLFNRWKLF